MNLLYTPSQSAIVKEICMHMDASERKQVYLLAFVLGLVFFCIPAILIFGLLLQMISVAFSALSVITLSLLAKTLTNKQKLVILNAQYAKDKGYSMADITQ